MFLTQAEPVLLLSAKGVMKGLWVFDATWKVMAMVVDKRGSESASSASTIVAKNSQRPSSTLHTAESCEGVSVLRSASPLTAFEQPPPRQANSIAV